MRRMQPWIAALLLCGAGLTCAQAQENAAAPWTDARQLASLGRDERRIWSEADDVDQTLRRRGELYRDAQAEPYLQNLADALYPEFKGATRVRIIRDPSLNAFALPNGSIYINLGLLARLENEAQLATVLAHEIAHFTQRHGYLQRQSAKGASVLALGVGMAGGVAGLLGQLAAVSSMYGFSREQESQADRVGFERVVQQRYDGAQALKIFAILRDEAARLGQKEPFMFASHPLLDERVQSLRQLLAQTPPAAGRPRVGEERFLQHTEAARQAWIEQAFAASMYPSIIHVLEQPGVEKRYAPQYGFYLGEAYRLRNAADDRAKAQAAYRRALAQAPDFAPTYRALGVLQMQEGKKTEARTAFQQYLAMAPEAGDRAFIASYLRQVD